MRKTTKLNYHASIAIDKHNETTLIMLSLIERQNEIITEINTAGKVYVESLAIKFKVSEVTIRSDLNTLGKKGLIVRSRGGAISKALITNELSFSEKHRENHSVKRRLGLATAALIGENVRSLMIDSGTTTEEVAACITNREDLTIMTNGFNVASALVSSKKNEIIVTGGVLRQKSMSFYGRQAENSLEHMRFDQLILGIDGIDIGAGITTYFEQEANLNRLMCKAANTIIAVADSTKFEQRGPHIICDCKHIDILVTDSGAPTHIIESLTRLGVQVVIAD